MRRRHSVTPGPLQVANAHTECPRTTHALPAPGLEAAEVPTAAAVPAAAEVPTAAAVQAAAAVPAATVPAAGVLRLPSVEAGAISAVVSAVEALAVAIFEARGVVVDPVHAGEQRVEQDY